MTSEERDLINGLFDRLRSADSAQKDQEAEQLIQSKVGQQPSAPYLLAQTVLVQEHALNNAQARITQLERQIASAGNQGQNQGGGAASGGGGFLSGLFGHKTEPQQPQQYQQPPQQSAPAYPSTVNMPQSAGGGFLRTALAAAAGVAGGSLLLHGFENLIGHNAGPFASSLGGMGGMGSGFLGGAGGSEIIENREVVNNYYNDNPNQDQGGGFGGLGLGGNNPERESAFGGGNLFANDDNSNDAVETIPPTDDNRADDSDNDTIPPTDDPADFETADSGDFDNSGGDDYSSNDDSGLV